MHNANVPRDDRAEIALNELMTQEDHEKQVKRVFGMVCPVRKNPRPEAGEEMDVGEPTVDFPPIKFKR